MKKHPQIQLRTGLQGWFKLEAVKRDGTRRLLADWFPNLITNSGLEAVAVGGYLGECLVGTGNTAPNVNDTALAAQVATTSTIHDSVAAAQPGSPYYGAITNTYRFAEGVAAGNLAEVGVGIASGSLFSRALILDGLGSPTTITVLIDEVLDVTYQLRLYPSTEADVTDSIVISAVSYNYTLRASRVTDGAGWTISSAGDIAGGFAGGAVTAYDDVIGPITGSPAGTPGGASTTVNDAYSAASHQRDFTCTWDLDSANFGGGIKSVEARFGLSAARLGSMQIEFDTPLPKDNTKVLTLGFRQVWARKTLP